MKILSTNELQEGMYLAQDVVDASGRVMLRSGQALRDDLIQALRRKGVAQVSIDSQTGSVTLSREERGQPMAFFLAGRYLKALHDASTATLKNAIYEAVLDCPELTSRFSF